MEQKNSRRGMLLMLLCAVMWSISGLLIKMTTWHSIAVSGGRSFFAALVMAAYMKCARIPFVLSRKSIGGAVSLTCVFILFVYATKLTSSANAIVLQDSAPIFVLLYNLIFRKTRVRALDFVTIALAFSGILLFFMDQLSAGGLTGNILAVLAGIAFAANMIQQSECTQAEGMSGILLGHVATFLIGLPFMFLYDTPFTSENLTAIVLLGVVQLGIPYVLYAVAAHQCSPLAISLIGMAEAVFNPIWVALAYGEIPGLISLEGAVILLGATAFWMTRSLPSGRKT